MHLIKQHILDRNKEMGATYNDDAHVYKIGDDKLIVVSLVYLEDQEKPDKEFRSLIESIQISDISK